jgi:hypothetical protein
MRSAFTEYTFLTHTRVLPGWRSCVRVPLPRGPPACSRRPDGRNGPWRPWWAGAGRGARPQSIRPFAFVSCRLPAAPRGGSAGREQDVNARQARLRQARGCMYTETALLGAARFNRRSKSTLATWYIFVKNTVGRSISIPYQFFFLSVEA